MPSVSKASALVCLLVVLVASGLYFTLERTAEERARSRANCWNFVKLLLALVFLSSVAGYAIRHKTEVEQPCFVSWRLYIFCVLGLMAMAATKLTYAATGGLRRRRRWLANPPTTEIPVQELGDEEDYDEADDERKK